MHGKGTLCASDGSVYTGIFARDQRNGHGHTVWRDGETYEGSYVADQRHGAGVYSWPDGRRFEGNFHRGMRQGRGIFTWPSGDRFEGDWLSDRRHGNGTMKYSSGSIDAGKWRGTRLVQLVTLNRDGTTTTTTTTATPPLKQPGPLTLASRAFLAAAMEGRIHEVETALDTGVVSMDVADEHGRTAVFLSACACHIDVVNLLLDRGADINRLTDSGVSPLVAVYRLGCGLAAEAEGKGNGGVSSEIAATTTTDGSGSGFDGGGLDCDGGGLDRGGGGGEGGGTKSSAAGKKGTLQQSEKANASGYEEEETLSGDKNVDFVVVDHKEMTRLLLRRGAHPNISHYPAPVLLTAVGTADMAMAKLFLARGANPNAALSVVQGGATALHKAIALLNNTKSNNHHHHHHHHQKGVALAAACQNEKTTKTGSTTAGGVSDDVSSSCCCSGKGDSDGGIDFATVAASLVSLLLHHGANPNTPDSSGQRPLHASSASDVGPAATNVVKILLKYGADPNVSWAGKTPLSLSLLGSKNDESAMLLLDGGADPNQILVLGGDNESKNKNKNMNKNKNSSTSSSSLSSSSSSDVNSGHSSGDDKQRKPLSSGHSTTSALASASAEESATSLARSVLQEVLSTKHAQFRTYAARAALVTQLLDAGADPTLPVQVHTKTHGLVEGTVYDSVREDFVNSSPLHAKNRAKVNTLERRQIVAEEAIMTRLLTKMRALNQMRSNNSHSDDSSSSSSSSNSGNKSGNSGNKSGNSGNSNKQRRFCYECGLSVGIKLMPCPRCRRVYFCSQKCKMRALAGGHRKECYRARNGGSSDSSSSSSTSAKGPTIIWSPSGEPMPSLVRSTSAPHDFGIRRHIDPGIEGSINGIAAMATANGTSVRVRGKGPPPALRCRSQQDKRPRTATRSPSTAMIVRARLSRQPTVPEQFARLQQQQQQQLQQQEKN